MESTPEQTAEGKAVVSVLAAVLERLVKSNAQTATSNGSGSEVTKFHALKAPGISIKQYLERIHKYASCSTECFVLALIYIDRLIQNNNFILSDLNVHRVVITAILLAAKFFDDAYYNNAYYAKVGGVLVSEMNGLEVEFLFRINFSLHVKPDVFIKYQDELVSHVVGAGAGAGAGAGLEQQQVPSKPSAQPQIVTHFNVVQERTIQQQQVVKPSVQPQIVTHSNVFQERTIHQHHHQQQQVVNLIPFSTGFTEQTHTQPMQCGNVTPSPPQNADYSQQQQQPPQVMHHIQHVQYQQLHQNQHVHPIAVPRVEQPRSHQKDQYRKPIDFHPKQEHQPTKQVIPTKNYQSQSNKIVNLSQTKDLLYATCCPYGGRLNPNSSSPGIFNTATRIYQ